MVFRFLSIYAPCCLSRELASSRPLMEYSRRKSWISVLPTRCDFSKATQPKSDFRWWSVRRNSSWLRFVSRFYLILYAITNPINKDKTKINKPFFKMPKKRSSQEKTRLISTLSRVRASLRNSSKAYCKTKSLGKSLAFIWLKTCFHSIKCSPSLPFYTSRKLTTFPTLLKSPGNPSSALSPKILQLTVINKPTPTLPMRAEAILSPRCSVMT